MFRFRTQRFSSPAFMLSLALFAAPVAAGCHGNEGTAGEGQEARPEPPPARVSVTSLDNREIKHALVSIGRVKNTRESMVAAKAMGRVLRVRVKSGAQVKEGDLLVELDSKDARARLEQARGAHAQAVAALKISEQMLARFESLSAKDATSKAQYDKAVFDHQNAEGAVRQAGGAMDQAEVYLRESRVKAPFDGRVVDTLIEEGELANPGMPLVRMEGGGQGALEFEATLNSQDVSRVAVGMPVTVVLDTERNTEREVAGKITEVVPAADAVTHTNLVRIHIEGADWLRSGMFGRARFDTVTSDRPGVLVDRSKVVTRGQLDAVYVVDQDPRVRLRLVRLGRSEGGAVEVLSGLLPGDRLVKSATEGLIDGQRAEITN